MLAKLLPSMRAALPCAISLLATTSWAQTTITVGPGQAYTTIQSGINAAANGDTVLVAPGTYFENIDFEGKAITVTSSGGAANTIIDGGGKGPAVTFKTSEPRTAVLSNITITHGGNYTYNSAPFVAGTGSIDIYNSSPTILNNTITQNYCWGIEANNSGPLIQGNEISATQDPEGHCSYGGGAGIFTSGNLAPPPPYSGIGTPADITGNTIENNVESGLEDSGGNGGAAIAVLGGSPVVENNILRNNASPGGSGGAINIEGGTGIAIVQNLIYGNSAGCGGGALAFQDVGLSGSNALIIANNTIVNNTDKGFPAGYSNCAAISQLYPSPDSYGTSNPNVVIVNNILSGSTSYPAVNCSWFGPLSLSIQPTFENNILYNTSGPFFGSYCVDVSAQDGNIATDPQFVDAANSNYHLSSPPPPMPAGHNGILSNIQVLTGTALTTDLDGDPRVQDATGKGCIVDMGAYEFPGTQSACSTTETLQSSLNPSTFGQTVTFTAQLSSTSGVPAGDVQFADGNTILGTETVSGTGISTFSTGLLTVGGHTITATYQPTGMFAAASAALTQVVTGNATATNLTCSPTSIPALSTAHLRATVTSANGAPTGSISFTDNGAELATQSLLSGTTSLTYTGMTAGTHTLTATYAPTGAFAGSSASCSEAVTALPTTSVLKVDPATSTYDSPVTLTAAVSPGTRPGPSAPTGAVTFYNGGTSIGTGTLANGVATLTLSTLPGPNDTLTCVYGGNSIYAGSNCNSVPIIINAAASQLSLTSSKDPTYALSPVTFTARLTVNGQAAGAGDTLTLSLNGQTLNLTIDATGSAATTVSDLTPGSYPVAAGFPGTASLLTSSASLTEVVNPVPTSTGLTVAPNPAYFGQTVTMTATVSAQSTSTPVTSGSISFFDGSTALGTQSVTTSGAASFTTSALAVGTHHITASFLPSNPVFVTSTSPVVSEVILASGFTIALSPTTLTLAPGAAGTAAIQLASVGNFAGPLALTYGTPPTYATASMSSSTITLTAGGTGSSTLTLNTLLKASNTTPARPGSRELPVIFTALLLGLIPFRRSQRNKLTRLFGLGLLIVALQAITGCTNSWYTANTVAPGTYQIPVTATDVNHNAQTATLTVMVTP